MADLVEKKDDNTIKVTKIIDQIIIPQREDIREYTLEQLRSTIASAQESIDSFTAQADKYQRVVDDTTDLLNQAISLGVVD